MRAIPNKERYEAIVKEVITSRNYVWDAYDQGRYAFASGADRNENPHLVGHVNRSDWYRGFDFECNQPAQREG